MTNPTASELGIGLIGVGRHGSRYVRHLLHDLPGVSLAAVCRRKRGEPFSDPGIPVYHDYHDLIADRNVHAVVVVTSPSLNRDICLTAVRAGKPLLIEKPLATNGVDARAMVAAARRAGIMIMTAQTLRFDPSITLMKSQLGLIGTLRSARLVSRIETKPNVMEGPGGAIVTGALLELGIHLLDMVRFVTGQEVVEVRSTMVPLPSTAPETTVTAHLVTAGGVRCALDIARVESDRVGTAEWVGERGTLAADWPHRSVTKTGTDGVSETFTVEPTPTILAALTAFVQAVRTNTSPPITGLDGCRAVEIADACYQSAADSGSTITLTYTD